MDSRIANIRFFFPNFRNMHVKTIGISDIQGLDIIIRNLNFTLGAKEGKAFKDTFL